MKLTRFFSTIITLLLIGCCQSAIAAVETIPLKGDTTSFDTQKQAIESTLTELKNIDTATLDATTKAIIQESTKEATNIKNAINILQTADLKTPEGANQLEIALQQNEASQNKVKDLELKSPATYKNIINKIFNTAEIAKTSGRDKAKTYGINKFIQIVNDALVKADQVTGGTNVDIVGAVGSAKELVEKIKDITQNIQAGKAALATFDNAPALIEISSRLASQLAPGNEAGKIAEAINAAIKPTIDQINMNKYPIAFLASTAFNVGTAIAESAMGSKPFEFDPYGKEAAKKVADQTQKNLLDIQRLDTIASVAQSKQEAIKANELAAANYALEQFQKDTQNAAQAAATAKAEADQAAAYAAQVSQQSADYNQAQTNAQSLMEKLRLAQELEEAKKRAVELQTAEKEKIATQNAQEVAWKKDETDQEEKIKTATQTLGLNTSIQQLLTIINAAESTGIRVYKIDDSVITAAKKALDDAKSSNFAFLGTTPSLMGHGWEPISTMIGLYNLLLKVVVGEQRPSLWLDNRAWFNDMATYLTSTANNDRIKLPQNQIPTTADFDAYSAKAEADLVWQKYKDDVEKANTPEALAQAAATREAVAKQRAEADAKIIARMQAYQADTAVQQRYAQLAADAKAASDKLAVAVNRFIYLLQQAQANKGLGGQSLSAAQSVTLQEQLFGYLAAEPKDQLNDNMQTIIQLYAKARQQNVVNIPQSLVDLITAYTQNPQTQTSSTPAPTTTTTTTQTTTQTSTTQQATVDAAAADVTAAQKAVDGATTLDQANTALTQANAALSKATSAQTGATDATVKTQANTVATNATTTQSNAQSKVAQLQAQTNATAQAVIDAAQAAVTAAQQAIDAANSLDAANAAQKQANDANTKAVAAATNGTAATANNASTVAANAKTTVANAQKKIDQITAAIATQQAAVDAAQKAVNDARNAVDAGTTVDLASAALTQASNALTQANAAKTNATVSSIIANATTVVNNATTTRDDAQKLLNARQTMAKEQAAVDTAQAAVTTAQKAVDAATTADQANAALTQANDALTLANTTKTNTTNSNIVPNANTVVKNATTTQNNAQTKATQLQAITTQQAAVDAAQSAVTAAQNAVSAATTLDQANTALTQANAALTQATAAQTGTTDTNVKAKADAVVASATTTSNNAQAKVTQLQPATSVSSSNNVPAGDASNFFSTTVQGWINNFASNPEANLIKILTAYTQRYYSVLSGNPTTTNEQSVLSAQLGSTNTYSILFNYAATNGYQHYYWIYMMLYFAISKDYLQYAQMYEPYATNPSYVPYAESDPTLITKWKGYTGSAATTSTTSTTTTAASTQHAAVDAAQAAVTAAQNAVTAATTLDAANAALTKASDALTQANTAKTNATDATVNSNATTVVNNATTTKNNAQTKVTQLQQQAAVDAAQAAVTTAQNAVNAATTLAAANTALTQASDALTQANTAKTNATDATVSSNATTVVNNATTTKNNAQTKVTQLQPTTSTTTASSGDNVPAGDASNFFSTTVQGWINNFSSNPAANLIKILTAYTQRYYSVLNGNPTTANEQSVLSAQLGSPNTYNILFNYAQTNGYQHYYWIYMMMYFAISKDYLQYAQMYEPYATNPAYVPYAESDPTIITKWKSYK
ncbi:MAG: hypothetical protein NTX86_01840 [Candidatus Dependentiae bacterium]|nr:hypothetical protein [Candidatus Dependentiae bacterium]